VRFFLILTFGALVSCGFPGRARRDVDARNPPVVPRVVTQPVAHDADDVSLWINPADPARSLIVGTDKDTNGALYVFDLAGRIVRTVPGLRRPNNVDIVSGLSLGGRTVDIAVTTEREQQRLRIFRLPEMAPLDQGGLVVFGGDRTREPMGVALYKRPRDGAIFAFVSGKSGPLEGYLEQYRLEGDSAGEVKISRVRAFGRYSGKQEIEAIAVDAALGYVYYSDETAGVRKYHADPDAPEASRELAFFGTAGFAADHEGISIYPTGKHTGYLIVSNQQADTFRLFPREGLAGRPHEHPLVASVRLSTRDSDGSEVTDAVLPGFPGGLFVAMSNDRTFQLYAWDDIARACLRK
jgi:3-phytase